MSGGTEATFDVQSFRFTGGASLYGFILFHEVIAKPASEGLGRLARLVAEGRLSPCISVEAFWAEVGDVAQRLLDRGYQGRPYCVPRGSAGSAIWAAAPLTRP